VVAGQARICVAQIQDVGFESHQTCLFFCFVMELPIELWQRIAFLFLRAPDILSLALSCKQMHYLLLGDINSPNKYDVAQMKATVGVEFCIGKGWWKAAELAFNRGLGHFTIDDLETMCFCQQKDMITMALPHLRDSIDSSILESAVMSGHLDLIRQILGQNPYKILLEVSCFTAARWGHQNVIEMLITTFPTTPTEDILINALSTGQTNVVKWVLDRPHLEQQFSDNQVTDALNGYHFEALTELFSRIDCSQLVLRILKSGTFIKDNVLYFLMNRKFSFPDCYPYVFRLACRKNLKRLIHSLLKDDRIVFSEEDIVQCLVETVANNDRVCFRLLLQDERFDPRTNDNYILLRVMMNGRYEMLEILLDDGRVQFIDFDLDRFDSWPKARREKLSEVILRYPRTDTSELNLVSK